MSKLAMASAPLVHDGRDHERQDRECHPENEDKALQSLRSDELANHQSSERDLAKVEIAFARFSRHFTREP